MSIAVDDGFTVREDLRGFNLMKLPPQTLHHVLSFLSLEDVVNFAFVSRRAFEVAKALTWEELDFSGGDYWHEDVANLCDRAQASCRMLTLPTVCE
jgi:hypothetical protein